MPDTKQPARHHHGRLKQALLDYALDAAQHGSLEALSLRKASRDLGVSPGAAYRHFPDRDSWMHSVAQRGFDRLADRFEAAVPYHSAAASAEDAQQRFVGLALAYVTFALDQPHLWRLMFGRTGMSPPGSGDRPSTYDWLRKSLGELAEFEIVDDPDPSAQFFAWTAIHGLSDLANAPAALHQPLAEVIERQCAYILAALSQR